jgi:hypothetical protein
MPLHTSMECQHTIINALGAANSPIVAAPSAGTPQAAQSVKVYAIIVTNTGATATIVTFQDDAGTAISLGFPLAQNGSWILDHKVNGDPWFQTGTNHGLRLNSSAAGSVNADVYWLQTP